MSASTKPYLIRALYEWCIDNHYTPHLVAWVNEHTRVPMQFVHNDEIVLNISPTASHGLVIDNDWVHFSARFGGVAHEVWIPVGHVSALFARENNEGMGFEVTPWEPASATTTPLQDQQDEPPPSAPKKGKGLKLVK